MSVWIWAYANHNIDFATYADNDVALVDEMLDKLNALNLSENEDVCKLIDCKPGEQWRCSWVENEHSYWPKTITLNLGSNLEFEVSKHFIFLDACAFSYTHWFSPKNDEEVHQIELWRYIFKAFVKALGGNIIEYFPDNMLEPYELQPSEMDNYDDLDFDTHWEIINAAWDNIYNSYANAVRDWAKMDKCPIVVEHLDNVVENIERNSALEEFLGPQIERKAPQYDPRFAKRVDGPTPNGGAYSIGFYYDREGNPCEPEQAATIHIHEYDKNDRFINETIGNCRKNTE